jgi:hypothetical protein
MRLPDIHGVKTNSLKTNTKLPVDGIPYLFFGALIPRRMAKSSK